MAKRPKGVQRKELKKIKHKDLRFNSLLGSGPFSKEAPEKPKRKMGRPTVMTPEVLAKLEQAFSIGANDREAIAFADISMDAFYDYQKKHPEFAERKEYLRQRPVLKAQNTIINNLEDPRVAQWYLERKKRAEFGNVVQVESDKPLVNVAPQVDLSVVKTEDLLKMVEKTGDDIKE